MKTNLIVRISQDPYNRIRICASRIMFRPKSLENDPTSQLLKNPEKKGSVWYIKIF